MPSSSFSESDEVGSTWPLTKFLTETLLLTLSADHLVKVRT